MMKKNRNNQLDLDLTSFIDILFVLLIVFIILFSLAQEVPNDPIVIINNPGEEDMASLVLLVEYDEQNVENRTIRMEINKKDIEFEEFELLEGENEGAYETLRTELMRVTDICSDEPILLSIYTDRILYRDYKKVNEIVEEIERKNANFYYNWKSSDENAENSDE